jgi:hypothetical protein
MAANIEYNFFPMVLSSSIQCPSSSQNTEKGPETEGPSTLRLNQNGPQYTHKVEILHMEETKHHESENNGMKKISE